MRLILAAVAMALAVSPANARLASSTIVGWASLNSDGTVVASKNLTGNYHFGTGRYALAFKTSISKGAILVTPVDPRVVGTVFHGRKEVEVDTFDPQTEVLPTPVFTPR